MEHYLSALENTHFLPGHHVRFQEWCKQYAANRRTNDSGRACVQLRVKPRPEKRVDKSKHLTVGELKTLASRGQNIVLRQKCTLTNWAPSERTLYVNWTNPILPGMGFTGDVPPSECGIDDRDELELFWSTDLPSRLNPQSPSLTLPLDNVMVLCEKVTLLRPAATPFDVLNVVWPDGKWNFDRRPQGLHDALFNVCQLVKLCKGRWRRLVVPLGRAFRSGSSATSVARAITRHFMTLFRSKRLRSLELLLPTARTWNHEFRDALVNSL